MQYRPLGRTGFNISTISFGAWAIGGDAWGPTDDAESLRTLHAAADNGVNFIDTADVYGDGHSERLVARFRKERKEPMIVATKAGRRLPKQIASEYNRANLTAWVDRSLKNLDTDTIDLLQLHCPPPGIYDTGEAFGVLDDFVKAGKLRYYGVSVETVDEALAASRYPNVQSVQIIFNMFRIKPAEEFFKTAREKQIGILARVPLASGMLSGKLTAQTQFSKTDHRNFNRHGEAFDVGETFSGVDYDTGLRAVEELRALVPAGQSMSQMALRWTLMFPEVTAAIPGARNPEQAAANALTADLPPLSSETMQRVREVYDRHIRALIHSRW